MDPYLETTDEFTVWIPGDIAVSHDFFGDEDQDVRMDLEDRYQVSLSTGPGGIVEVFGLRKNVLSFLESEGVDLDDCEVPGEEDEDRH